MTPQDARLLTAVADVNETLDRVTPPYKVQTIADFVRAILEDKRETHLFDAMMGLIDAWTPRLRAEMGTAGPNEKFAALDRTLNDAYYMALSGGMDYSRADHLAFNALRAMGRE